jgi:nitrile hydratase subunit beta
MSEETMPAELTRLLQDDDGALYADDAAARAIAIVMALFRQEHYSWPEWVDRFSAEIGAPGYFRQSEDGAEETAEALTGDGENINRNYANLWLAACEKLLLEKGLLTHTELSAKLAALRAEEPTNGAFAVGARVVVLDVEPVGNAHLPLFVRGKTGIVERRLGGAGVSTSTTETEPADTNLLAVYSIRFTAREIWGSDAPEKDSVNFSIGHDYLAPA